MLRRQARRLEQAISDCKAKFGRDPTEPEIAAELHMSLESLQHLMGDLRGLDISSLQSDSDGPGGGEEAIQSRPGSEDEDPFQQTLRSEMTALLARAIGELPDREIRDREGSRAALPGRSCGLARSAEPDLLLPGPAALRRDKGWGLRLPQRGEGGEDAGRSRLAVIARST